MRTMLLYLLAAALAIVVFRAIGWLVAIVGALLVIASLGRPGLRKWPGWRRLPGLSGSQPVAAFAVVLALYTVAAPVTIWRLAQAGGQPNGSRAGQVVATAR
ncbi:MAG TPA: hypothetical protein VFD01_19765, partial [Candidatus Dormibacteraeota bacterium]|nr:hypothetical protein [Candidatus Dormibacteraeota bacterium]